MLEVNPSEGKKRARSAPLKISDEDFWPRFIREFKKEQEQKGNPFPSRHHQLESDR